MKLRQIGSNMTELEVNGCTILFSYETPVACTKGTELDTEVTDKKWSKTTSSHINKWLDLRGFECYTIRPQEYFDNLIKRDIN